MMIDDVGVSGRHRAARGEKKDVGCVVRSALRSPLVFPFPVTLELEEHLIWLTAGVLPGTSTVIIGH